MNMFDSDCKDDFLVLVDQVPVKPAIEALRLLMHGTDFTDPTMGSTGVTGDVKEEIEDREVGADTNGISSTTADIEKGNDTMNKVDDFDEHDELAITEEDLLAFANGSRNLLECDYEQMRRIVTGCKCHRFDEFMRGLSEKEAEDFKDCWGNREKLADVQKDVQGYLQFVKCLFKKQKTGDSDSDSDHGNTAGQVPEQTHVVEVAAEVVQSCLAQDGATTVEVEEKTPEPEPVEPSSDAAQERESQVPDPPAAPAANTSLKESVAETAIAEKVNEAPAPDAVPEKSSEKPADDPTKKPAEKSAEDPTEKSAEEPVEKHPTEKSAEEPDEKPASKDELLKEEKHNLNKMTLKGDHGLCLGPMC